MDGETEAQKGERVVQSPCFQVFVRGPVAWAAQDVTKDAERSDQQFFIHPYLFCLSFYLLYFFLPPFEDSGLLFWVPDVLCRYSEVVLWNLLGV